MGNLRWLVVAAALAQAGAPQVALAQAGAPAAPTNLRIVTSAPPPGVTYRAPDGGTDYFARFSGGTIPSSPSFFPLAVWFESVISQSDIDLDKGAGLNTYVVLTVNSDAALVASNGMYFFAHQGAWKAKLPFARAGWELDDEVDMIYGAPSGFTHLSTILSSLPADNKPRYANYGKGVMAWLDDVDATQFVNAYTHVTSADFYFWTDLNICEEQEGGWFYKHLGIPGFSPPRALTTAECRAAWNYGYVIDRLRQLDGMAGGTGPTQRRPMWGFVELGNPWSQNVPKITPAQVRAAVWHMLIAEARGIIYFNHTFGGACISQHILRDPCYATIRAEVTTINQRIVALAPVLNAAFADGYVTTSSGVRVMTKYGPDGAFYVFAGSKQHASQTVTFTVAAGATVEVLFENRTLTITGGKFSDTFADGNAIHIYRITGG